MLRLWSIMVCHQRLELQLQEFRGKWSVYLVIYLTWIIHGDVQQIKWLSALCISNIINIYQNSDFAKIPKLYHISKDNFKLPGVSNSQQSHHLSHFAAGECGGSRLDARVHAFGGTHVFAGPDTLRTWSADWQSLPSLRHLGIAVLSFHSSFHWIHGFSPRPWAGVYCWEVWFCNIAIFEQFCLWSQHLRFEWIVTIGSIYLWIHVNPVVVRPHFMRVTSSILNTAPPSNWTKVYPCFFPWFSTTIYVQPRHWWGGVVREMRAQRQSRGRRRDRGGLEEMGREAEHLGASAFWRKGTIYSHKKCDVRRQTWRFMMIYAYLEFNLEWIHVIKLVNITLIWIMLSISIVSYGTTCRALGHHLPWVNKSNKNWIGITYQNQKWHLECQAT